MENHQNMESDIDIELQVTLYTLAQAISKGFNVSYHRAKEILNKALHNRDNNTAEIAAQIFHIESED